MNSEELTDRIYDTLFENKQNPQFPIDKIEDQFVSADNNIIMIKINDEKFYIRVLRQV